MWVVLSCRPHVASVCSCKERDSERHRCNLKRWNTLSFLQLQKVKLSPKKKKRICSCKSVIAALQMCTLCSDKLLQRQCSKCGSDHQRQCRPALRLKGSLSSVSGPPGSWNMLSDCRQTIDLHNYTVCESHWRTTPSSGLRHNPSSKRKDAGKRGLKCGSYIHKGATIHQQLIQVSLHSAAVSTLHEKAIIAG